MHDDDRDHGVRGDAVHGQLFLQPHAEGSQDLQQGQHCMKYSEELQGPRRLCIPLRIPHLLAVLVRGHDGACDSVVGFSGSGV